MLQRKGRYEGLLDNNDSIFTGLPSKEMELLLKNNIVVDYKKSELIFKEGDKPTGLICLIDGKVKVFKEGIGGREQIIRMAKPKEFIGYRALFAEENYSLSASAIEDCSICILDKDALIKVIKQNSDFSLRIIKELASELGFSNSRTVTLTQKHIRGRLAESLLFLRDTYGFEEDGATLNVFLSREDIANLSNMTTSNCIRTLTAFAEEAVISINGRRIKLIDLQKLEKISNLG